MLKWYQAIISQIVKSKGYKEPLLRVVKLPKFWHFDRTTNKNFVENADTGDILLFRGKATNASI